MTRQRIERKPIAHHCAEAIDRPAQIGRARREVDADGGREGQHAERRAVTAPRPPRARPPRRPPAPPPRPPRLFAPPDPERRGGILWAAREARSRLPAVT